MYIPNYLPRKVIHIYNTTNGLRNSSRFKNYIILDLPIWISDAGSPIHGVVGYK